MTSFYHKNISNNRCKYNYDTFFKYW